MAINSGLINAVTINGAAGGPLIEDILETIGVNGSDTNVLSLKNNVEEVMICISSYITSQNTKISISESIVIVDLLGVIINESLAEGLGLSESFTNTLYQVGDILETLLFNIDYSTQSDYSNIISESVSITDANTFGLLKVISESISLVDTIIDRAVGNQKVLENIVIAPSILENHTLVSAITELLTIVGSTSTRSTLISIVEELITLSVGTEKDAEYLSYLLSPETFSVSTYSNYNFTGSCVYGSVPLFINLTGLFKYGSGSDVGEAIVSSIQTAALDFGTSNLKQVPNIYLGLSNSNRIVLKVAVDGQADILYNLTKKTDGLQTQNISIGKGLIGRYFQFELITQDSTRFELESVEFLPITLKRKL